MQLNIEKLPSVQSRTGLSRSTIYNLIKKGQFPAPIALGPRSIGFVSIEVDQWIQDWIDDSRRSSEVEGSV